MCEDGVITYEELTAFLKGWFGYAVWANTYKLRKDVVKRTQQIER